MFPLRVTGEGSTMFSEQKVNNYRRKQQNLDFWSKIQNQTIFWKFCKIWKIMKKTQKILNKSDFIKNAKTKNEKEWFEFQSKIQKSGDKIIICINERKRWHSKNTSKRKKYSENDEKVKLNSFQIVYKYPSKYALKPQICQVQENTTNSSSNNFWKFVLNVLKKRELRTKFHFNFQT